ncbi:ABC transporter substrate-binding protein [Streptomyces apricus]|uniref:Extracellular solute-binding protein n=1 Tax=Streptomyces apricus TaxID=1828112 RepID=A0A5B0BPH9_9ACTN|nr:extracellular solute-binding protein [Streptomyces apricus]KAA0942909.1 extracellular solute-binding protein [Streptomyces apricus]
MQRRVTGLIAVVSALSATAALGGCGSSAGDGPVTLRLVAADYGNSQANSSQKYWDKLTKAYEADHPDVDVEVSVYSWNDVDAKVKSMVAAGDPPDLAQIGAYADYAADGLLYRADDVLSIDTQSDFVTQLSAAGQVNQSQYGMPFASSTRLLFYNKDLFADAGVTPPKTWGQLASAAAALKAQGVRYPYALPLGPEEAQAETMMWLLGNGAGYTDEVGSYDIDSEQNVETFTWLKDKLVGKGLTGPVAPGKLNRAQAFAAFTRGEVGMLNGHPTLMKAAAEKGVKFGMVPMPGVDGRSETTLGVADWMMAFKKSGHREQIGDFLDYVYSDKNVLEFSHEYDLLPVTTSASEAMAADADDADLLDFLEELPNAELPPVGQTSWARVSADIKQEIGTAVSSTGSPAGVLGHLQRGAAARQNAE